MPVEVKQRMGSNLLPVPMGDGTVATEQLEALNRSIASVQADLKAAQDEQALIRQKLERRDKAVVNVYVGGSGAGDSLIDGRGLVPELPFAHLEVAIGQTVMKDRSKYHIFNIQDDLEENRIDLSNAYGINIVKGSNLQTNPKIVLQQYISLGHGSATLLGLDIESNVANAVLSANSDSSLVVNSCNIKGFRACIGATAGASIILLNNSYAVDENEGFYIFYIADFSRLSLNGTHAMSGVCSTAAITVLRGGKFFLTTHPITFSGDVTGKKYQLTNNATLMLNGVAADSIPGTLAGVCDTSSQVIA